MDKNNGNYYIRIRFIYIYIYIYMWSPPPPRRRVCIYTYIYMGVIVGNVGFLELSCLLLGSKATTCHLTSS